MGFGAYVPTLASPNFEETSSSSFDMSPYEGSYSVRVGSKNSDDEPTSLIRKMLTFKGTAIHSSSGYTLTALLNSN